MFPRLKRCGQGCDRKKLLSVGLYTLHYNPKTKYERITGVLSKYNVVHNLKGRKIPDFRRVTYRYGVQQIDK